MDWVSAWTEDLEAWKGERLCECVVWMEVARVSRYGVEKGSKGI